MPVQGEFFQNPGSSAGGFYNYQIEKSARFDRESQSYMQRTLGTPSNADIGTFSLWFKKILNGAYIQLFHTYDGGGINFMWYDTDKLYSNVASGSDSGVSDAVFRDTTGWGHIVSRVDTTQSSNDNRCRVYFNGTELSGFTGAISQNTDYKLNKSGNTLYLGHNIGASYHYAGYLAEVIFTDGQSYAPTQFGESKNGVWIPKDPSGTTFGNNGFHLKFNNTGQGIFPSSVSVGGASADSTSTGTINLFSNLGAANPPANRTQTGQGSLSYSIDLGSAKTIGAWLGQGHQSSGYATRTATGTVSHSDNNSDFTSVGSSTYTFGNGVAANGHTFTPSSHRYWKIEFPSASGGDGSSGYQIGGFFLGAAQSTTVADLGTDSSGNGNNFTVSNMGVDHQSIQSPTHGN